MRFLHIADLHFGKVVHGVSMLEAGDQRVWAERFLALAETVKPDAVLIAGDVYDRSTPSGEAVKLLSGLIEGLAALGLPVLLVAGNHDSGERLAFARELLAKENVHIAGRLSRRLEPVTLRDEFGPVRFWLLPYVYPALVGSVLEEELPRDYDAAVRRFLAEQSIDPGERNVLLAHQNVTAGGLEAERGGSEAMVGGVGQIDYRAFDAFDYAALGHIHAACPVGRESVRYAGSPLCYHFNETRQPRKGPLLVELGPKGTTPRIETLPIPPLHPMRELRGAFRELLDRELAQPAQGEYLRIVLTDQRVTPQAVTAFQTLAEGRGSVIMDWSSEYRAFQGPTAGPEAEAIREKPVEELFADFYRDRSGEDPSEAALALLHEAGELLRSHPPEAKQRGGVDPVLAEKLLNALLKQEVEA